MLNSTNFTWPAEQEIASLAPDCLDLRLGECQLSVHVSQRHAAPIVMATNRPLVLWQEASH